MKKYLFLLGIFLMIITVTLPAFAIGPELVVKKRVAVSDFTIRQNRFLNGQEAAEFARTATEKVINAFAELKQFQILDRTVVMRLQREKQIQMLGYQTKTVQANLGAIGKADIYCTGEVQNISLSQKYDTNHQFLGYDGEVEMQIKIYDLSTSTLILSKDVRGGTEVGGGFLSIFRLYQDTPSKAVFKALNNAEREIKETIIKAFPLEGNIVEVVDRKDGCEKVLITLGANLGFKSGDELSVIEVSQIKVNGVTYPRQKEIGCLMITSVEPDGVFSEAKIEGNNGKNIIQKYEAGYKLLIRTKKK